MNVIALYYTFILDHFCAVCGFDSVKHEVFHCSRK
jgi:hypothetical protein